MENTGKPEQDSRNGTGSERLDGTAGPIGIVGLGPMGAAIFRRLMDSGYDVIGHDNSDDVRSRFDASGALSGSLTALLKACDRIVLALPNASAVRDVCLGANGISEASSAGALVVDTSTSDPSCAREVADRLKQVDIDYLEGPVSGGQSGASEGTLTMMLHASPAALERSRDLLDVLAGSVVAFDAPGTAQAAKLLNNLLVATQLVAVSEAMKAATSWGLEPQSFADAINQSSARSAVSEINFPRWILNEAFDSGFSMRLMRKDVAAAAHLLQPESGDAPGILHAAQKWWAETKDAIHDHEDFNKVAGYILNPSKEVSD